ncbi:MAG TPA: ribosome recycling factor [Candidatus Paceibacterota bacterium]|nr:ribosome recycling factor [Candidatus Paceibacterota bacterium]
MAYNLNNFKEELKKANIWLANEFSHFHTGRANVSLLDAVIVSAYGAPQPLRNTASIASEDPKTLRVVPWDKSLVKEIERAITASNLGVSAIADDNGLRVVFPALTTERKQQILKLLKDKLEQARITIRGDRDKVWSDVQAKERERKLSEDDKYRLKDDLQKLVDEANKNLEAAYKKKEAELMI